MKCKSCSESISSKFIHALSVNLCPFCGESIMSEELQIALSELTEVMKYSETYKEEMFEWLKTNYNLIDGNSEEYKALTEKKMPPPKQIKIRKDSSEVDLDENGNQLTGQSLQNPESTNVFMNRAGIKPPQENYKDIVARIKGASINSPSTESLTMTDIVKAKPEDIEAMENMLMQEQAPAIHSAISYTDDGDDDLDPIAESLARMGDATHGGKQTDYNARDMAKLQKLQSKSQGVSKELGRSGGVGMIRRSE